MIWRPYVTRWGGFEVLGFNRILAWSLAEGGKTARVHYTFWRRCGIVAARGARTAGRNGAATRHART